MSRYRVMVVGARSGSLGDAVIKTAQHAGYETVSAGITGEAVKMDCLHDNMEDMTATLHSLQPRFLVCTVGMNIPMSEEEHDVADWYRRHFETNVTAPMRLLAAFREASWSPDYLPESGYLHYVGISSNSAHLPRSSSAAYCASKAAFSMALRVAAREGVGGDKEGLLVYGYEPGLLAATPMTEFIQGRFAGQSLTRMRGEALQSGIDPHELAELIVANFRRGPAINGTLIRYDCDEL